MRTKYKDHLKKQTKQCNEEGTSHLSRCVRGTSNQNRSSISRTVCKDQLNNNKQNNAMKKGPRDVYGGTSNQNKSGESRTKYKDHLKKQTKQCNEEGTSCLAMCTGGRQTKIDQAYRELYVKIN